MLGREFSKHRKATKRNGRCPPPPQRECPSSCPHQLPLVSTPVSHHNLAYEQPPLPSQAWIAKVTKGCLSPKLTDMWPCWPSSLHTLFYRLHSCHLILNFPLPLLLGPPCQTIFLSQPFSAGVAQSLVLALLRPVSSRVTHVALPGPHVSATLQTHLTHALSSLQGNKSHSSLSS